MPIPHTATDLALMANPARLLYLNASFDLSLSGHVPSQYGQLLSEMTLWFLPVGSAQDKIILDTEPPPEYLEYLSSLGLDLPAQVKPGDDCSGMLGFPWGCNTEAVVRLEGYGASLAHPDLSVVKQANSRQYSMKLARELGLGLEGACVCRSEEEVVAFVGSNTRFPYVVKPAFGNAGIGFVFVRSKRLSPQERTRIHQLFVWGNPCVIVEPWLEKVADISTTFHLCADGETRDLRHYRALTTLQGAFYGVVLGPGEGFTANRRSRLDRVAKETADALHKLGYFGPVNIDSIVAGPPGAKGELVPLIEINARHSMSLVAYSLRERLAPKKFCLFRTVGRKRHTLPMDYEQWLERLGSLSFNEKSETGVVCVTPLLLEHHGERVRPHRSIFFLAAETEEEMRKMDRKLTKLITV